MYTCLSLFCNLWHIEFVCDMCGNLWHIEGHAMYAVFVSNIVVIYGHRLQHIWQPIRVRVDYNNIEHSVPFNIDYNSNRLQQYCPSILKGALCMPYLPYTYVSYIHICTCVNTLAISCRHVLRTYMYIWYSYCRCIHMYTYVYNIWYSYCRHVHMYTATHCNTYVYICIHCLSRHCLSRHDLSRHCLFRHCLSRHCLSLDERLSRDLVIVNDERDNEDEERECQWL